MIRKATAADTAAIVGIYGHILEREAAGLCRTGWKKGIYPTEETVCAGLAQADLFVWEEDGAVLASGRINQEQVDVYARCPWVYPAPPEEVMVLHTLAVEPSRSGRGVGAGFVAFYEDYAREKGCSVLRIDTNETNAAARRLYARLGYRESGVVFCRFNDIDGIRLVCLEKKL